MHGEELGAPLLLALVLFHLVREESSKEVYYEFTIKNYYDQLAPTTFLLYFTHHGEYMGE